MVSITIGGRTRFPVCIVRRGQGYPFISRNDFIYFVLVGDAHGFMLGGILGGQAAVYRRRVVLLFPHGQPPSFEKQQKHVSATLIV